MSENRHKHVRRALSAPRAWSPRAKVGVIGAGVLAVGLVGGGVGLAQAAGSHAQPQGATGADLLASVAMHARPVPTGTPLSARMDRVTRSLDRLPTVVGRKWTTAPLNEYLQPDDAAGQTGLLEARTKVPVTSEPTHGFTEVLVHHSYVWVHSAYLSAKKPAPPHASTGSTGSSTSATGALVFKPCPDTAGDVQGVLPDARRAWEAVCNAFPQVKTFGGLGPREEHDTGQAVDAMVYGDSALGQQIADFLKAHAQELNLYDIIWQQHIWTPVRASEGWRLMPDRGSPTANHMDHVHFAVNN